jgi:hypothetical protein
MERRRRKDQRRFFFFFFSFRYCCFSLEQQWTTETRECGGDAWGGAALKKKM